MISIFFKRNKVLIIALFLFLLLRIPVFFQGLLDIDESIYFTIARDMLNDSLLYVDIWDHKPPGMNLIYLPFANLNPEVAMVFLRLISVIVGLFTVVLIYKILKILNVNKFVFLLLLFTSVFLLGSPILEGGSVNSEIFFLPINLLLLYRVLKNKVGYFDGILLFLSFLIKPQAFIETSFIIALYIAYKLITKNYKDLKKIKKTFVTFLILIAVMVIIFIFSGNFLEFINAVFVTNGTYLNGISRTVDLFGLTISIKFILTILFVSAFIFGNILILKKYKNKTLANFKHIFFAFNIVIWVIYLVLIPERPSPHYLIQYILGLNLLGFLISELFKNKKFFIFKFLVTLVYLNIILLFIFSHSTLNKFATLKLVQPPIEYYVDFTKLVINGNPQFLNKTREVYNLSIELKSNLDSSKKYFIYTIYPWIIPITNFEFSNKYILYTHISISGSISSRFIEDMLNSDVALIQNGLPQLSEFKEVLEGNFFKESSIGVIDIYKKIPR